LKKNKHSIDRKEEKVYILEYHHPEVNIFMRIVLPNNFVFLLKAALTVVSGTLPVCCFLQMLQRSSAAAVVCNGVYLLVTLYIFGIICSVLYSGSAAQSLTDFLFFPKRYLKKAPPVLSRQQGLIANGCFEEAETELLLLRQSYKSSPEITQMLITLHGDCLQDIPAAIADCRFFFANRKWRRHELNLPILLRYADFLCAVDSVAEARQILAREQNTFLYAPDERKAIRERLSSLSPDGRAK
jgi:hypothetical protein